MDWLICKRKGPESGFTPNKATGTNAVTTAGGLEEFHADEEQQPANRTSDRNELNGLRDGPFGLGFVQGLVDVAGQGFSPGKACLHAAGSKGTIMYNTLPVNVNSDNLRYV
jgi:hypothetical protein